MKKAVVKWMREGDQGKLGNEYLSVMLQHGLGLKIQRGIRDTSGGENSRKPKGKDEKAWNIRGESSLYKTIEFDGTEIH